MLDLTKVNPGDVILMRSINGSSNIVFRWVELVTVERKGVYVQQVTCCVRDLENDELHWVLVCDLYLDYQSPSGEIEAQVAPDLAVQLYKVNLANTLLSEVVLSIRGLSRAERMSLIDDVIQAYSNICKVLKKDKEA